MTKSLAAQVTAVLGNLLSGAPSWWPSADIETTRSRLLAECQEGLPQKIPSDKGKRTFRQMEQPGRQDGEPASKGKPGGFGSRALACLGTLLWQVSLTG